MNNEDTKTTDPAKLAFLALFPVTGLLGIHDYLEGRKYAFIAHILLTAISTIVLLGGFIENASVGGMSGAITVFLAIGVALSLILANLIFAIVEGGILVTQNAQLKRPKDRHTAMMADIIYSLVAGGGFLLAIMIAQVSWFGWQVKILGMYIYGNIILGIVFLLAGIILGIIGAAVAQKPYAISLWVCLLGGMLGFFLLVL